MKNKDDLFDKWVEDSGVFRDSEQKEAWNRAWNIKQKEIDELQTKLDDSLTEQAKQFNKIQKLIEILHATRHLVACKVSAKQFIMNELDKLDKSE